MFAITTHTRWLHYYLFCSRVIRVRRPDFSITMLNGVCFHIAGPRRWTLDQQASDIVWDDKVYLKSELSYVGHKRTNGVIAKCLSCLADPLLSPILCIEDIVHSLADSPANLPESPGYPPTGICASLKMRDSGRGFLPDCIYQVHLKFYRFKLAFVAILHPVGAKPQRCNKFKHSSLQWNVTYLFFILVLTRSGM